MQKTIIACKTSKNTYAFTFKSQQSVRFGTFTVFGAFNNFFGSFNHNDRHMQPTKLTQKKYSHKYTHFDTFNKHSWHIQSQHSLQSFYSAIQQQYTVRMRHSLKRLCYGTSKKVADPI